MAADAGPLNEATSENEDGFITSSGDESWSCALGEHTEAPVFKRSRTGKSYLFPFGGPEGRDDGVEHFCKLVDAEATIIDWVRRRSQFIG